MNTEKRNFLIRYRNNQNSIKRLNEKIDKLDERINAMRMSDLTGMPRGSAGRSNYDLIDEKCDLEKRIAKLIERGKVYRDEICEKIDMLKDVRYINVLEAYFIDCLEIEDIAAKEGYSERHIRRLYSEAIDMVEL